MITFVVSDPIVKGDKNSAKAFCDMPSACDGQPRLRKYAVRKSLRRTIDIWQNGTW